ncbi:MAG: phospholipid carrier-dependent glycosyltransferase [Anaerolineaceae bacterium]|nr:MAG: phospholipid carrier-dependent glycosyltransferase [Anaerolineaceae bacterium]
MDRKKFIPPIIYIALTIALLMPRITALDSFVTLDEPSWLSQGANFYYALGQREFQNTVYEYQPAVTTMWIVSVAMLLYFPEYRGFGQGYLDYEKGRLDPFMYQHGRDPLVLLHLARLIQVLVVVALFMILYYLLQRLIPRLPAAFAILFASFDPFFLGQSRLLDHEAMVSLFVVVSLLAFVIYLSQDRKWIFLLISGVAAGLAQLTKSSAIAMLAPVGVLLLIRVFQEKQNGMVKALTGNIKIIFIWFFILIFTYFVFWPGMWVAPGKMLYEVYGNAFSYAFQGARLKVTEQLDVSQFRLNANLAGMWGMSKVLFWRTTPLTWLGILFGFALPFTARRELVRPYRQLFTLLLTTTLAFIFMIGIAQGRNSPHYILSSYLALNLLAGLGWFHLIQGIGSHPSFNKKWVQNAGLTLLLFFQVWSAVSFYPYYFTYRNPISYSLSGNKYYAQFPYGEGLELAAQYLAELPNAKESTALVYYSRGCFSYFYPGISTSFRPYYVDGEHAVDLLNFVQNADYIVVYYANQGRLEKYKAYLDILSTVEPMHEIWLDGYKYIQIYQVDSFPPGVFEALANL